MIGCWCPNGANRLLPLYIGDEKFEGLSAVAIPQGIFDGAEVELRVGYFKRECFFSKMFKLPNPEIWKALYIWNGSKVLESNDNPKT